jgi:hypothetical protein
MIRNRIQQTPSLGITHPNIDVLICEEHNTPSLLIAQGGALLPHGQEIVCWRTYILNWEVIWGNKTKYKNAAMLNSRGKGLLE